MGALCTSNKNIPQELILGNLMFVSLNEMSVPYNDLTFIFHQNNIPDHYARSISAADAYRRASSDLKRHKMSWMNDATGETQVSYVNVDEVKCTPDVIKRVAGFKVLDDQQQSGIDYIPFAELCFDRKNESVHTQIFSALNGVNYGEAEKICKVFTDNFSEWSVFHTRTTIRNILTRILNDTHPINILPTGLCKFTPKVHTDTLHNIRNAILDLNKYVINNNEANTAEIIPVIDTEEQRDLVNRTFTNEVTNEMEILIRDLRFILQTKGPLSSRTAASYIERFRFLREKADDYSKLLNIYTQALQDQLKEAIELVNDNTTTKKG